MNNLNRTNKIKPNKKLWEFHGGVHPPFHKSDSNQLPIGEVTIPDTLILPLQQHSGRAAQPIVKVGDNIFKGQLIAQMTKNGLSANLHAPTSGTIDAIEKRPIPHSSGLSALCIILNTDGKDDWGEHKLELIKDFTKVQASALLERIQLAGIVGLGGAAFPSAVKLAKKELSSQHHIDTLIINGAECEPYITCDDRLMREKNAEIMVGIQIIQQLIKPKKCLIGIEDNKAEAIKAMQHACQKTKDSSIEVISIPTIYPSGGEKQLIEILTGKEVPANGLPRDIGILGLNVGTLFSIYNAVVNGIPLISRIVTITGNGVQAPQNFEVLIGTSFHHLAALAGGLTKMADHLIMGGPMMGYALEDDQTPVVKATNCALFISTTSLNETNSAFSNQATLPCIRCGKCMHACPVNLLPQQLYWHIRAKDFEKTIDHNLYDCIECGCCSYVCPSHIPLVDYYRFAKAEIKDQQEAKEKADVARERHEFLIFRKERDKRERDEKRAAHKAALQKKKAATKVKNAENADSTNKSTVTDVKAEAIKAALERSKAKKEARQLAMEKDKKEDKK
ncbi:MAG: electron transport complex subunit RsxC [Cocleimonas sp.]